MNVANARSHPLAAVYCVVAGAGDAVTGLLLVVAPIFTLGLMRIADLPSEPVYLRLVGAFVGGVGLSYLFPFLYRDRQRRERTLAVVLEITALIRVGIAVFVGWAIASSALSAGWTSVLATDLVLAAVQIVMVKRGVFSKGPRVEGEDR